jgi:dynein heavy chain|tara:strand:+ start:442 stop:681 length:240 start_codon:yes stop_codon:yes gene_type:complete
MKRELALEIKELDLLIGLVREDINNNLRKCVNTLIVLDVHAKDVVDGFVRDSILSAKQFEWESVLRFYWDNGKDNATIK